MLRSIASLFFHVLITKNRAKVKEPLHALFFHFFKRINMSLRSAILSFSVLLYSSLSCVGTLYLYLGPTFSGKTTSLIFNCRQKRDQEGKKVLCFRHVVTRDGNTEALDCQKDGLKETGIILNNDNYKETILATIEESAPDIVIVDEVSFFPQQFSEFIFEVALKKDIDVYCAGMEIGVEATIFPGAIELLISKASDIATQKKLRREMVTRRFQAVCYQCKKKFEEQGFSLDLMPRNALFMNRLIFGKGANIPNKIIPGYTDDNGNKVVEYVPTCVDHYVEWDPNNVDEDVQRIIDEKSLN